MIEVIHAPSAGLLTQTVNADGFSLAGGTTPRTLSVISADVVLNQSLRTTDSPTFAKLALGAGTSAAPSLALGQSNQGWYSRSAKTISVGLDSGANPIFELDANSAGIRVAANYSLGWSTTSANAAASLDTFLSRASAGVLQVGTTAANALGRLNVAGTTIAGGTVTVDTPLVNATQTWNAAGVTFTGLKLNVTNTASATASMLLDLQVGGASKFSVSRTGFVAAVIGLQIGSTLGLDANNFYMASTGSIRWGATLYADDLFLYRDAAAVLAQRNGTNAQTKRLYGTYTNASNYERIAFYTQAAGVNVIDSEAAGTGTRRGLQILTAGGALGFFGVTPIARAVLATGTGATVDNVITALQNLGLVSQT